MKKSQHDNFIRETCVAGATIWTIIKYSAKHPSGYRSQKNNPTREAVVKNNDRIAVRLLTMLMNANFHPGDWHITLTYRDVPPEQAEAKRQIKNFKDRLGREYAKRGIKFRWIEVTEYNNHRIHHHMVLTYIEPEVIERQWKCGHVRFTSLDRTRNYRKLAEYYIKETSKTMREPGNETKKRWSSSRNLIRPIVKREKVSASIMWENPKAIKGYEIDEDTVRRYEHPYTGIEHLEYMMCSTDPVPRIKTWRKGKVVERNETYRRASEIQIDMDSLEGWDFM
ncbi:MAG: hypothetical protein IKE52_02500 [Mogibacterium sp.]|nr:hypothetical protein [Mogibacterium sp.]